MPRADAVRNRQRLIDAAEALFARDGLGVSVEQIAREAAVGVGTLYRHFPTKNDLVAAIVLDRVTRLVERAEAAVEAADPDALVGLIEHMVAEGATKRDFVEALGGSEWFDGAASTSIRARLRAAMGSLVAVARAAGTLRADVSGEDLLALVKGIQASAGADPDVRARHLAIVLAGLRPR